MKKFWSHGLFVCFGLAFSACIQNVPAPKPIQQVVFLCPTVVYVKKNLTKTLHELDSKEAFEEASKSYTAGLYKRAQKLYQRILFCFPNSSEAAPAKYNLGLTLGRLGKDQEAIQVFLSILSTVVDAKDKRDALFRLGAHYIVLKQWQTAESTYKKLLLLNNLEEASEKLEAMGSLGKSLMEQKKYEEAEEILLKTVRLYQRARRKEDLGRDYFAALSYHLLGRRFEILFEQRQFREKKNEMKEDLEFKAKNLLMAQKHFLASIRIYHHEWSMASLFHLGQMYQRMYLDMVKAPIPGHLSAKDKKLYVQLLKKKILNLLKTSMTVLQRSIRAAQIWGVQKSPWFQKINHKLAWLRTFYLKEHLLLKDSEENKP